MPSTHPKIGFQADRLKTLRETRQLSQREFARQCGFSETLIRKYEAGESDPAAYYLKIISDQMNVSADYLLGISDSPRGHLGDDALNDDEKSVVETLRHEGWQGVIKLGAERLSK